MKHALIRLREERRVLTDSYTQVVNDRAMSAADPAGRSQMLVQLLRERREVAAAIELIEAHMRESAAAPPPLSASTASPPSRSAAPAGPACS